MRFCPPLLREQKSARGEHAVGGDTSSFASGRKATILYTPKEEKPRGTGILFQKNKNNTYSASLSTTSTPDASGEGAVLLKSESHTAEMDGIYLR